jgi:hypothetical protein
MLTFRFPITRRRNCAENRMHISGPLVLEGNYLVVDAFQAIIPIQNGKRALRNCDRASGLEPKNAVIIALEDARLTCALSIDSRVWI